MMQALENRMAIGEYYEDEAAAEEDLPEMPHEAFDRRFLAIWAEASRMN